MICHDQKYQNLEINFSINAAMMELWSTSITNILIDKWKLFFLIKDKLITVCKELDEIIDESNMEKILYIASLLKNARVEIKDDKFKLVILVSILELLLTHNPDFNRFNVEDSISKQFRLKTSILVYQNNKTYDLEWIKERLKEIYNQRSNISHGNFKKLQEYLAKEVKKSGEEDICEGIILERFSIDLYIFIRATLEEYLKDRKLVDFLKKN